MLGTLAAIASIVSAGAGAYSALNPQQAPSQIMNDSQWDRHQRQLNRANPQEILRQTQFLEGLANPQAQFQDAQIRGTMHSEAERAGLLMQEQTDAESNRVDQLSKHGLTAWELLGSNPSVSQVTAPSKAQTPQSQNPAMLGQLVNAATSLESTKIASKAQVASAALSSGASSLTQLANVEKQTKVQYSQQEIEKMKVGIQRFQLENQIERWNEMTENEKAKVWNETVKIALEAAPRYKVHDAIGNVVEGVPDHQLGQLLTALENGNTHYMQKQFPRVWAEMQNQDTIQAILRTMGVQARVQEGIATKGEGVLGGTERWLKDLFN
jgi:predicted Fe-S protein YdhL (DUF1289 family)